MVNIPIVEDLNSNEGTEYFIVQLAGHSVITGDLVISLGNIKEAFVYIQDEIIISLEEDNVQVEEGGNLTLTVTASIASDQEFNITMIITNNTAHCK